jgi:hypothetical protein
MEEKVWTVNASDVEWVECEHINKTGTMIQLEAQIDELRCTLDSLPAVSPLLNLEAARQGRSVLFSDEQKLLFEGGKKGFVKNTKLDFMRRKLNLE